jgi:hypothetical protein
MALSVREPTTKQPQHNIQSRANAARATPASTLRVNADARFGFGVDREVAQST